MKKYLVVGSDTQMGVTSVHQHRTRARTPEEAVKNAEETWNGAKANTVYRDWEIAWSGAVKGKKVWSRWRDDL